MTANTMDKKRYTHTHTQTEERKKTQRKTTAETKQNEHKL